MQEITAPKCTDSQLYSWIFSALISDSSSPSLQQMLHSTHTKQSLQLVICYNNKKKKDKKINPHEITIIVAKFKLADSVD